MSAEFRQRTPAEFVQMAKRRKWQIILPAFAVFAAVFWVVRGLPNVYESTAVLTLSPPAISEKVAPSLTDEDLSQRLQSINQSVLSRSSLEPMIEKHKLYEEEVAAGVPMERIVDEMRNHISVVPEKAHDEKVVGFRLSYRYRTAKGARDVTAELANKYVTAQTAESTQSAEITREFINNQMNQAKSQLDALEQERLRIMLANVDTLPESGQGLIAQLEGLRQREATISKDKETLLTEQGRVHESIRALNSQMRLIENFGQKETDEAITQASRVEDTPAYGQLVQKRAEYSARLENLKKQYREKHPEIIQTQTEIAKINDELEKLAKNTDQRVKMANLAGSRKAELQKRSLEIEREKADSQLEQIARQMRMKDDELRENAAEIAGVVAKINTIPNVRVAMEGITNQYESAKSNYDELVKKFNNAQQQVQVESNAQGETIRVVDPANLPQSSENASKKPFFLLIGAALGLGIGLLFAAAFEVPRWFTIQNIEDAKHYTALPVLVSIPPLHSDREIRSLRWRHWTAVLAGMILACLSVPVLAVGIQASRIFERLS
jgi:polysaccharide biosynthesis transport protein